MTASQIASGRNNRVETGLSEYLATLNREITAGIALIESPYLYIQAAGSDGSDGSADGIHLYWDFLRSLAGHLAKGNLAAGPTARYPAPYGFNKADDFVTVLRVPYSRTYPCTVNFSTTSPTAVVETGPQRLWKFDTVVASTNPGPHREVVVRFADIAQYDAVRPIVDPLTAPSRFLARYKGIVEVEVTNQLCFALSITAVATAQEPVRAGFFGNNTGLSPASGQGGAGVVRPSGLFGDIRGGTVSSNFTGNASGGTGADALDIGAFTGSQDSAGTAPTKPKEGGLRVEAISVSENLPGAELFISCRKRMPPMPPTIAAAPPPPRICAEDVRYFRFDYTDCTPAQLRLETYEQFIIGAMVQQANDWHLVGNRYALTDQDAIVYGRLEDPTLLNVNGKWPRYFGADPASGLFTTSVPNYKAKWDPRLPPSNEPTDDNGLKKAVISYLTLSMNPANPTALASLPAQNPVDGGSFDISYLQMLKMIGLDFHAGRMLGSGCLDGSVPPGATTKYVYLAIYRTTAALEPGGPAAPRTHIKVTLPTARIDYRLPPAPVQDVPTLGLSFDNGTGSPTQLTDADGYALFDDARIINLHIAPYDTMQALGPFFQPPVEFCSSDVTQPVFYGCKYKQLTEANYRTPELSNDPDYLDPSGMVEVAPLLPQLSADPNAPNPPIYTHQGREDGLFQFVFYPVNRFSRPGPLSNPRDVNTLTPIRHTLLPPANLAAQLIQFEDAPLLTTAIEQQKLNALAAGDATLVRCTFDWNHNHYITQKFSATNEYADKVQFYFRREPPRAVQGAIKSVTSISSVLAEVRTQPYTLASVSPPQTVTSAVVPGDEPRFVGSSFAADQVLYVVDSVAQSGVSGEGAVFHIRKQVRSAAVDLDNNNRFSAAVQVTVPSAGDRFLVVENMNEPANWGANQPLAKEVTLVNFLESGQLRTEPVSHPDAPQTMRNIGGIQQSAYITELEDIDAQGQTIPGSKTGIFEIAFLSYQLANHPDPDVEWYRGVVRVREAAGNNIKVLQVWKIDVSGANLKLTAYDPTFTADPNAPPPGYRPIQTGSGVAANFHPSYRFYLTAQAGLLDQTTTLPGPTESGRQTFLAARARNTTLPRDSSLTAPVVMQARKLTPPLAPDEPVGPIYATRPNVEGKATWTTDVKVTVNSAREPYALVFYRANERAVLDTLYDAATADAVEAALKALPAADAAFAANRWKDLVNVQNLHADHSFREYIPGGYRFPIPNNQAYVIPGTSIAPFNGAIGPGDPAATFTIGGQQMSMLDVVKGAIEGAFVPLTEAPLPYQFIKTGTQTSSRQPVTRNRNGNLLAFSDPAFDPAPMAVKYVKSGDTLVRFTDYKLDGASRNIYFYYAVELSDQMKFGPRSPIAGPVHLVNAFPAEPPVIRKVTSVIGDPVLQFPAGVKLVVNAYIAAEGITKFKLYRASSLIEAATTRTMTLVRVYDAAGGSETELFDDFSDLDFLPVGDSIYYCVVALRAIINERGVTELIPSLPSILARASVIDVKNPVAPALVFSSDPPTMSSPVQLTNVMLSWKQAAYNATYYLYKQDVSGTWNRIYTEKTNAKQISVPLSSTALGTGVLAKQDADRKPICHRFMLEVESASGTFSLNQDVLSVPATCKEALAFFGKVLSYADDFQSAGPLFDRLCDPAITTFPGTMTFQDIIASLPPAHVFDRIEITVADGLGHAARKTIGSRGGAVTFHHGDGPGLVLDGSVTNVDYNVRVKVFTDSCQDGLSFRYTLRFGPEIALMGLTGVLSYADSATTTSPLGASLAASGLQFPTTMTFTDITVLPTGHTFVKIDILVQDDLGASFAKSIGSAGGSVTFNQGDGGLTLDGSAPNRTYRVSARLFTNLSPHGILFNYGISYV